MTLLIHSDLGEKETKPETVLRNAVFIHLDSCMSSNVGTNRMWPRRDPARSLWEGDGIIFNVVVPKWFEGLAIFFL